MMKRVILYAISMVFQMLTKDMMIEFVKAGMEKVKELTTHTDTTVDDIAVEKASMLLLGALEVEGNTNTQTETDRLLKVLGGMGGAYIEAGLDWLDSHGSFQDEMIEMSTALVRKLIS